MRFIRSLANLMVVALSVCAVTVHALPNEPHIRLSATASQMVAPDSGTIAGAFEVVSETLEDAQSTVHKKTQGLIVLMKDQASSDILELDSTQVYPIHRTNRDGSASTITGYRATKPFSIKLSALSNYPKVSKLLFDAKVDRIQPIRLEVSNADEIRQQLTKQAIKDAHTQAQELASVSNQAVSHPFSVSVVGHYQGGPVYKSSSSRSTSGDVITHSKQRIEAHVEVVFIVK